MSPFVLCDGWHWPDISEEGDPEPASTDLKLALDDGVIDITRASDDTPLASVPVEAVARLLAEAVGR
jgi:hypothetical protein